MRQTLAALLLASGIWPALAAPAEQPDPYLWLEQVESPRALDWVRAENERTLRPLLTNPHYQPFLDQALALAQANDRIPAPEFLGGQVYNLWQDAAHVQGIWRRASVDDYRAAAPHWQTVLDVDALGRAEHHVWVWKGDTCDHPADTRCLVSLSEGGEDAVTTREFDLSSGAFVPGGFMIPHAKQVADWENADSILVGTDWGPGSMTESGYPFIIKRLHRGQPLAQASEVFRGTKQDVTVQVSTFADGHGHRAVVLERGLDFFHNDFELVSATGVTKLALPQKAEIEGLVHNQLVVKLNEALGATQAGSLVALDMAHPDGAPVLVWAPGPRQSIDEVAVTANAIVASVLDNVRGRAMVFTQAGAQWKPGPLPLPDNAAVSIVSTSVRNDQIALQVTSFLQPTSLYFADLEHPVPPAGTPGVVSISRGPDGKTELSLDGQPYDPSRTHGKLVSIQTAAAIPYVVKALPAKFDSSRDTVEQFETASTDGTKIPYFVVHPKDMRLDGSNPTLLYAYGGFQVSETPTYSAGLGKLWLERGGVYVLANIRGGGEFGPAWHEAGLKTHRQRIYDDFASVARDLIARRITTPRRLGIRGGSNGGLLMGVEFEQHPDLWNAVIIDVPLLDMLRFEQIAAGASWVGEYGTVAKPEERSFLASISPYANLRAGVHYPVPFIFTTTRDDRVGPVHARKFAARMQAMGLPFYYHESIEGGHAAGANLREAAEEQALEMTYLTQALMP